MNDMDFLWESLSHFLQGIKNYCYSWLCSMILPRMNGLSFVIVSIQMMDGVDVYPGHCRLRVMYSKKRRGLRWTGAALDGDGTILWQIIITINVLFLQFQSTWVVVKVKRCWTVPLNYDSITSSFWGQSQWKWIKNSLEFEVFPYSDHFWMLHSLPPSAHPKGRRHPCLFSIGLCRRMSRTFTSSPSSWLQNGVIREWHPLNKSIMGISSNFLFTKEVREFNYKFKIRLILRQVKIQILERRI